jgi:hypothetical protein
VKAAKSLKEQNRWQLWLIMAANMVALYGVAQADVLAVDGLRALFNKATNLLPVGLACVVTTVANGLLSADTKARIVFFRWKHALPGHRAFSYYGPADARVDMSRIKKLLGNKLPTEPDAENRVWYRLYKSVETYPAVEQVHKDFLMMRDYAALSALFFVGFGAVAIVVVRPWTIAALYCLGLLLQYVAVRRAAATYGARFVTTVLAQKSGASAR